MELLEFKGRILELCKCENIGDIRDALMFAVLNHDTEFFGSYVRIIDEDKNKDWLQALWQYYEADRQELKQDYTPKSLGKLVARLAGPVKSVYDCCGGSGALTKAFADLYGTDNVVVEELDERVIPFLLFNLCLSNVSGYVIHGDALSQKIIKCYRLNKSERFSICTLEDEGFNGGAFKADVAISNPPYNIKWEPPFPIMQDTRFPVMPTAGNANFAFVFNCMNRADKSILILPQGIMTSNYELESRKYLVDNDLIEAVISMPSRMFESTSIPVCLLVLNKWKKNKGEIVFINSAANCAEEVREQNGQFGGDSHTKRVYKKNVNVILDEHIDLIMQAVESKKEIKGFGALKKNGDVADGGYILTPSRYIENHVAEGKHRNYQEIADNINHIVRMRNSCKLVINETIAKRLGLDVDLFKKDNEQSSQLEATMKSVGVKIEKDDFIQFTKNKNEFILKCNDKDLLPDILLQTFYVWKNQIALLNTMQNKYLAELRDALLPDLMSGKISVDSVAV